MKVNLGIFAFVCLFSPVASYSQSFEGFRCSAFAPIHILGTPARSNSVAEKTIDIVLVCTGGIPTPSGSPLYRKTFDVSLNTQPESRQVGAQILGSFQTDALAIVNETAPGQQLFCSDPPAQLACNMVADGRGGGTGVPDATDYNGSPGHYNVFPGYVIQPSSNIISFVNVPVDPPGQYNMSIRLTNIRVNASAVAPTLPIMATVSTYSGFPIDNPQQMLARVTPALTPAVVSNAASFAQCPGQTLQPAFTVTRTEVFGTVFLPRFTTSPMFLESTPGSGAFPSESGFLVNGFPLTTNSPGVADSATRLKVTFGDTPSGVTLYVPLTIYSTNLPEPNTPPGNATVYTFNLTATESGPFSAVTASPGTNGAMAAVTNGVAIYELVALNSGVAQSFHVNIGVPVYLSYSPATQVPAPGTGSVRVTLAPTVPSAPTRGNLGPIPAFLDDSTSLPTYTITPCVNSLTPLSGTPQSTTINTAFAAPLQAQLKDMNGNTIGNSFVTYTLPINGPGALFAGGSNVATVSTNAQGIATSPQVIANGNAGTFTATATTGFTGASFLLTNLLGASTISFAPIPNHFFGDPPFVLSATATPSTAPITFTLLSGPATITGNFLTMTGTGNVTVMAAQAATANYQSAGATQSFVLSTRPDYSQTISFPPLPDHNASDASFVISATASSGLPVVFTVVAGPATISGTQVTLTGAGLVSIEADQPGNAIYPPAPSFARSFHSFGAAPAVTSIFNGGYNSAILAPDSHAEIFGSNLAAATITTNPPFPAQIGGLTLILTDSAGKSTPLLLTYVSPAQINLYLPSGIATGAATIVITNAAARTTTLNVTIAPVSPGLFSTDGTGKGNAAAQSAVSNGQLYLTLYGTGFRNAKNTTATFNDIPAQILYAGPQGQFPGLDQLNLVVSAASLSTTNTIQLTSDSAASNALSFTQ